MHIPEALGKYFVMNIVWMPITQETCKMGGPIMVSSSMSTMHPSSVN